MPRKARSTILYDGCYAHVFSRSIEKKFIFKEEEDLDAFGGLLLAAKRKFGFHIFHYCLLHTHFHLAVGLGKLDDFSAAMKWLKWQYTQGYNREKKRRGTVWQGRFNSLVIEDENYLRACGLYIERNPIEAGIVARPIDWRYSSSRFYECGTKDSLVDRYEWGGVLPNLEGSSGKNFFEKGLGIGDALFQIHLKDGTYESMTVPEKVSVT